MRNIFWTGYSSEERISSVEKIKNIVSLYGDLVDFKFFSDISLTVTIEVEEFKIDKLYQDLKNHFSMDEFQLLNAHGKIDRVIYFHIHFSKGTGNLKTHVPE